MLSHREPDKARHYLDLLDAARCNGQWQDIPELTRKVRKHFPLRQCLVLTAQTERHIVELSTQKKNPQATNSLSLSIPPLLAAVENETTHHEDSFQAHICLAWLHSVLEEPELALSSLPPSLDRVADRLTREGGITARWTHVCIIKGAYFRGLSLEVTNSLREAARTYGSMMPYISSLPSRFASTPEHQSWTGRFLARFCMLSSSHIAENQGLLSTLEVHPATMLAPFRAYAHYWDSKNTSSTGTSGQGGGELTSYMHVWQAYYNTLSILAQRGTVQPAFESKLEQGFELKRVEAVLEDILQKEFSFPKADQANTQVDSWVDQVMANWRVMCGSTWQDVDLVNNDKAAVGQGVLDILYRAATRTFHSTRVLRHLFTVHASLAEIELATKALDSYLQILTKGKARVEKSGEEELGLDDDATSLAAAAAGIKLLCTYGRRIEAEKAMQIAGITETWLQKLHPNSSPRLEISAGDVPKDLIDRPKIAKPEVPGNALALGFHAIGVSQACWARLTYETSSRSGLQSKAIANLRAALDPVFGEQYNIEFLYSLAYVLAEIGDLDGAICAVKEALSVGSHGPNTDGISRADFSTDGVDHQSNTHPEKRGLFLRCWHLLALLLSARQTFSTAIASCEAALELYGGKAILYGNLQPLDSLKDLEPSERKNIIEIKMTQLALAEVVDSPEEAVNASGELLGLYTKLFEYSEKPIAKTQEQRTISPQSDTNGTRTPRSFRESILGLPKDSILRSRKMGIRAENTTSNPSSYASPDDTTVPPSISVTGDAAPMPHDSKHHSHYISRHGSNKLRKRNSRKSIGSTRKSRAASPSKTFTADGSRHHGLSIGLPAHNRQVEPTAPDGPGDTPPYEINRYAADEVGVAISHDLPSMPSTPAATSEPPNPLHSIPSATQNMNHRNPNTHPVPPRPPPSQRNRPQPISTVEYAALPEPHFPPLDQSRHALTLLNKIWLLVASLYRRASMLVDAQGALSEATRHVQTIEMAIATHEGSSAESFATGGYGKLKSCGELWADVLAEQAALHVAHGNTDDASAAYEGALDHCPDHVAATIGLANILLDSYSATEPEPKSTESHAATPTLASPVPSTSSRKEISHSMPPSPPDLLARLAARDRAYGLLSALTKSGKGWDCGEAWYALARAYEESGQVEKAKEALWWVVELEEGRAVREWGCIV